MKNFRSTAEALFGALWYLVIVIALPTLFLLTLGLIELWQRGWILAALGSWLGITMVCYAVAYGLQRASSTAIDEPDHETLNPADGDGLPGNLAANEDWSARDRQAWQLACTRIDALLNTDPHWRDLEPLELLGQVASHYHPDGGDATWRFTLPEALLIIEEASRRYRALVEQYLPYADRVTIATVLSAYERKDQISSGFTWANRVRRLVRLVNPIGAVIGELRDQVTDRVFARAGHSLQLSLKRLLLQEIAQAAIDLYSGRLKVSDAELSDYTSAAALAAPSMAVDPDEPLRILLVGQISSGKSTLINALLETAAAEADLLPATARVTVHAVELQPDLHTHLVDTPGISTDTEVQALLIEQALTADLILWVSRATQPARATDLQLRRAINERFAAMPERRAPPVVLAISHTDLISGDAIPHSERAALMTANVFEQLEMAASTPAALLALSTDQLPVGLPELLVHIAEQVPEALQVQRNRRRVELTQTRQGWRRRLRQTRALGGALADKVRHKLRRE